MKIYSANIYLLKVNNGNTRKRREICSNLTIKTLERRQWRRSSVSIVNFEQEKDHRLLNSWICERKWVEAYKEVFTLMQLSEMHQSGRVKKYFVLKTFCNGTRETYATEWTLSRVFLLGTLFHNKFSKLSELLKDNKVFSRSLCRTQSNICDGDFLI